MAFRECLTKADHSRPFGERRTALPASLLAMSVLLSCVACTAPDPVQSAPPAGNPSRFVGCPDGRQGHTPRVKGRGAFGVVLDGTDGVAPNPLPPAATAGVKNDTLPTALFWKAPLAVSTPADITLTIKPPHYLAYMPASVWANSPNGVDAEPWLTREFHISPCADGSSQSYLGGLLIDPAQPCITVEIEAVRDGHTRRSELRLHPAGC